MEGGESAALTYLVAQVPAFANPFLNGIASWLIGLVAGPVETYLVNNATAIVINIQTTSEEDGIVQAATALKIAQASGNAKAIEGALLNAKQAYSKICSWDGTFSPS